MPNNFSTEEVVAFDQVLQGFDDALVLSRAVDIYNTDAVTMARTGNTIWRPMPYIATSQDGTDQTGNFRGQTQLSVPSQLGYWKSSTAIMTAEELRDALQEQRLGKAARQKLASDINVAVMTVAANQGTLFVKRSAAATGYDDVSQCEAICNEQGVMGDSRYLALTTRDYNGMASNLQQASRSFGNAKSDKAYENSFVGRVASFDTYKLDYPRRLTAAAGGAGITMSTLDGGGNYYVPAATYTSNGATSNVDNRYQTITVSSTTSVAAGDAFTIANVYAVHHITKTDTGQLKTFRVISVPSSTTLVISPPIISAQIASPAQAELQYQNVTITTKASNSAIVFLNTVTAGVNPFWRSDAIELMPGTFVIPEGAGVQTMKGTTEQGINLTMTKYVEGDTLKIKYRWDTSFGVTMTGPEQCGVMMFSQT